MRTNNIQKYANSITTVTDIVEKTGDQVDPFFQQLKDVLKNNKVSELGTDKLSEIKDHFQIATDAYRKCEDIIQKAQAPVRLIGKHRQFQSAFKNYTSACQNMVDAVDPEKQTVDEQKFNQSEADQEQHMEKVTSALTRIMNMLLG
ncbi:hypothetical protein ABVF11_06540 [Pediococcus argentinicus]|uniref:hypothetical protein n=1 Tax=Pediococcus argentinicus TaxID=480391 RepID=UPI00338E8DEB